MRKTLEKCTSERGTLAISMVVAALQGTLYEREPRVRGRVRRVECSRSRSSVENPRYLWLNRHGPVRWQSGRCARCTGCATSRSIPA